MKPVFTHAELDARIAARDAERDRADERRRWLAEDRREEVIALGEITLNSKTGLS
jgi:hypothetical protein